MGYNIGIIIQCRMGSSRLPGKALIDVEGQPMLERLYARLKLCKLSDLIIVATSEKSLEIIDFCRAADIEFTVGPEDDLLSRHLLTAKEYDLTAMVRVTADNPLTDPGGIEELILSYEEYKNPVIHNKHKFGYPYGTGAELIERSILAIHESHIRFSRLPFLLYNIN